ncbi:MAG: DUF4079 family protein [Candidatus Methylomirabilia bacterium]
MVSGQVVSTLQLAHVSLNGALLLAFAYQGLLGRRIRQRRVAGVLQDFSVVKRHRALGPVLATLLPIGYLAGLITVYLHKGLWVRFPGHFAAGTVLVVVAGAAVLVSTRIRGAQSPWRTPHLALGVLLLCVFIVQVYLGLNIFL